MYQRGVKRDLEKLEDVIIPNEMRELIRLRNIWLNHPILANDLAIEGQSRIVSQWIDTQILLKQLLETLSRI